MEFALLFTLMLTLLFGVSKFGIALYNKSILTDASRAAARTLAIGRTNGNVWTDTRNAFSASAPGITTASITISINGTACTSNSTCASRMSTATGLPATVRAQYPCNLKVIIDFAPGCKLTATTTQRVE